MLRIANWGDLKSPQSFLDLGLAGFSLTQIEPDDVVSVNTRLHRLGTLAHQDDTHKSVTPLLASAMWRAYEMKSVKEELEKRLVSF